MAGCATLAATILFLEIYNNSISKQKAGSSIRRRRRIDDPAFTFQPGYFFKLRMCLTTAVTSAGFNLPFQAGMKSPLPLLMAAAIFASL